jgi:hypothetical protein
LSVYKCKSDIVYICNVENNTIYQHLFWKSYNDHFYKPIMGRYIHPYEINTALKRFSTIGKVSLEGHSVLGKPIHSITLGTGSYKILGWSQMHGNESTTTKAVLDLLSIIDAHKDSAETEEIFKSITLKIILQLNPDGCEAYTRFNANEIDLNRDAQDCSQPESIVLRAVYKEFTPHLCLNLHDQRTIYNVNLTPKTAAVSFLSPSQDIERSITVNRKVAMQYISAMNTTLSHLTKGHIGRYDDGFNINCVGDTFQNLGTPTILFEAGHLEAYDRNDTRKAIYAALLQLINCAVTKSYEAETVEDYMSIPQNDKKFYDIILRNVAIKEEIKDIAIQYREELDGGLITFRPYIAKIDNLNDYYAHKDLECSDLDIQINTSEKLAEEIDIVNVLINGKKLSFVKNT